MTKATHAPGPWRMFDDDTIMANDEGGAVAHIYGLAPHSDPHFRAESEANRDLIVAAPDLLDALTNLLCFASPGGVHGTEPDGWSDQAKRFCGAARAAIAKAKGGAA